MGNLLGVYDLQLAGFYFTDTNDNQGLDSEDKAFHVSDETEVSFAEANAEVQSKYGIRDLNGIQIGSDLTEGLRLLSFAQENAESNFDLAQGSFEKALPLLRSSQVQFTDEFWGSFSSFGNVDDLKTEYLAGDWHVATQDSNDLDWQYAFLAPIGMTPKEFAAQAETRSLIAGGQTMHKGMGVVGRAGLAGFGLLALGLGAKWIGDRFTSDPEVSPGDISLFTLPPRQTWMGDFEIVEDEVFQSPHDKDPFTIPDLSPKVYEEKTEPSTTQNWQGAFLASAGDGAAESMSLAEAEEIVKETYERLLEETKEITIYPSNFGGLVDGDLNLNVDMRPSVTKEIAAAALSHPLVVVKAPHKHGKTSHGYLVQRILEESGLAVDVYRFDNKNPDRHPLLEKVGHLEEQLINHIGVLVQFQPHYNENPFKDFEQKPELSGINNRLKELGRKAIILLDENTLEAYHEDYERILAADYSNIHIVAFTQYSLNAYSGISGDFSFSNSVPEFLIGLPDIADYQRVLYHYGSRNGAADEIPIYSFYEGYLGARDNGGFDAQIQVDESVMPLLYWYNGGLVNETLNWLRYALYFPGWHKGLSKEKFIHSKPLALYGLLIDSLAQFNANQPVYSAYERIIDLSEEGTPLELDVQGFIELAAKTGFHELSFELWQEALALIKGGKNDLPLLSLIQKVGLQDEFSADGFTEDERTLLSNLKEVGWFTESPEGIYRVRAVNYWVFAELVRLDHYKQTDERVFPEIEEPLYALKRREFLDAYVEENRAEKIAVEGSGDHK